jgi:uroporphyrin-III C-methyltransferase
MEEDAYAFELKSPAILVIGAVAACKESQKIAACGNSYTASAFNL